MSCLQCIVSADSGNLWRSGRVIPCNFGNLLKYEGADHERFCEFTNKKLIFFASLPVGLFAAYVAWLVVPEVVRVIVPEVVKSLVAQ